MLRGSAWNIFRKLIILHHLNEKCETVTLDLQRILQSITRRRHMTNEIFEWRNQRGNVSATMNGCKLELLKKKESKTDKLIQKYYD